MQNGESFFGKKLLKIAHGLNFALKIIPAHKVKLGDDYHYPIKGSGEASYKLESGMSMKMKYVLFVSGLKKNLLSIFALDAKCMRVAFVDGQVLMW